MRFIHLREYKYNSLLDAYGARHINAIVDQFKSLEEVTKAVRAAGLESSNLIFGKKDKTGYLLIDGHV